MRLLQSAIAASVMLFLPSSTEALTFVQILSLFHVMTGFLLTFTILLFAAGFFVYLARLGTWPSHRDQAIKVLEWGVALLFVLIVLLALLRFFQLYTNVALTILAVLVLVTVAILIMRNAAAKKEKKEER